MSKIDNRFKFGVGQTVEIINDPHRQYMGRPQWMPMMSRNVGRVGVILERCSLSAVPVYKVRVRDELGKINEWWYAEDWIRMSPNEIDTRTDGDECAGMPELDNFFKEWGG